MAKSVCNAREPTDRGGPSIRHHRHGCLGHCTHDFRNACPRFYLWLDIRPIRLAQRDEEFFPILEVSVNRAGRHSCAFCHRFKSRVFVAIFTHELARGLKKRGACPFPLVTFGLST